MMHTLAITVQQRPEVLERLLRVTRHRGFKVTQMQMQLNDDASMAIDLQVEAERAIELLSNQLDKLIDVTHCEVKAPHAKVNCEVKAPHANVNSEVKAGQGLGQTVNA